jgi:PTH1 family peptidyl-tRNA hydrolase
MKLIAGLGNPGDRYAPTRHNVGFRVVDDLAERFGWHWEPRRERALIAQGTTGGEKLLLIKPQTFMNDSGLAVGALLRFYKAPLTDLLVVCDDLDLPTGRVRLRERGSSGGQRGVESIITHVGTMGFARLRVGIGRPPNQHFSVVDYVLGIPPADERTLLREGEERAAEAALVWALEGPQAVMNRFNTDPKKAASLPTPAAGEKGVVANDGEGQ